MGTPATYEKSTWSITTSPCDLGHIMRARPVDDLGLLVDDLEHPSAARPGLQRHVQDLRELVQRPAERAGEDEERRDGADIDSCREATANRRRGRRA